MKYYYRLKNLDCPNCAAGLEAKLKKIEGLSSVAVDYINRKLMLELSGNMTEELLSKVKKVAWDFEGIEIIETGEKDKEDYGFIIARLVMSAALLVLAYFLPVNRSVSISIFVLSYLLIGYDILFTAVKNITKGKVFDENFLMVIATIGAFALSEFAEGVFVMLFFQVGELFQRTAVGRSRKSITEMMGLRSEYANVFREGKIEKVKPGEVKTGEIIVVKPGEKFPLDGKILEGASEADTSALTGENTPKEIGAGDTVLSGSVNLSGLLKVEVTSLYRDSTVAKILSLVEDSALKKAPSERFITKFASIYTPVVVGLALLIAVVPPLLMGGWSDWIETALIFLMVSCPCALVISVPMSFFAGVGCCAKNGILIKGSNYLELLSDADVAIFDKTGTLTEGKLYVEKITAEGMTEEKLLEYAAKLESGSNHPIARAILKRYGAEASLINVKGIKEKAGFGLEGRIGGDIVYLGNRKLMKANGIEYADTSETGTVVYIAVNGKYSGYILIADRIRETSRDALELLRKQGVKETVMLTGDEESFAKAVAEELNIDRYYSGLLPGEKVKQAMSIIGEGKKVMFTGDGINDAPVLAAAHVGIAMGGMGSDAALEAADVVLMDDNLKKLSIARKIAKKTKKIVKQNIVFALGVKAAIMALSIFGLVSMWWAIFADVGVMVLAVINSLRCLKIDKDKTSA